MADQQQSAQDTQASTGQADSAQQLVARGVKSAHEIVPKVVCDEIIDACDEAMTTLRAEYATIAAELDGQILAAPAVPSDAGGGVTRDPRIALCITTFKRLWQLRLALPIVLRAVLVKARNVRVYLGDFNPGTDTSTLRWLADTYPTTIEHGLLKLFTSTHQYWHACIMKNGIHYAAARDDWKP